MKVQTFNLGDCTIVPLGDLHIGSEVCMIDEIKSRINYIKDNNYYTVLCGDILNNSTKDSVACVYNDKMNPQEQLDFIVKLFEPIKDRILAVVSGNHELRSYKSCGIDLMKEFCDRLGISEKYQSFTSNIIVNGKHFLITHGSTTLFKNKMRGYYADFFITAHTHTPLVEYFGVLDENGNIKTVPHLVCTSWLGYESYAQMQMLPPSPIVMQSIYVSESGDIIVCQS